MAETYEQRVAAACAAYRAQTGRAVPPERLDRGRPEVRAAYAAFAAPQRWLSGRGVHPIRLAAADGVLPLIRVRVAPDAQSAVQEALSRSGLTVEAAADAAGPRHAVSRRAFFGRGRQPPPPAAPRRRDAVLFAGTDPARVREALRLHAALAVPDRRVPLGPDLAALGRLRGIPECCIQAFGDGAPAGAPGARVAAAAQRSQAFRPALNVLSPGLGRYLPWQPCRFDCAASVATAQAVRAVAARVAPETVVGLDRAFALPRLHGDARCQVIFVGSVVAPMRVRYRTVCTPYALDRSAEDAALEWVFFMDAVAPLLLGETATVSDGEIQVQREGSTVARLPLHWDATFLPFAPG